MLTRCFASVGVRHRVFAYYSRKRRNVSVVPLSYFGTNTEYCQRNLSIRKNRTTNVSYVSKTTAVSNTDVESEYYDKSRITRSSDNSSVDKSLRYQLDVGNISPHFNEPEYPSDVDDQVAQHRSREQSKLSFRPEINPTDTSIILFPGQASCFVGMGAKLLVYPKVEKLYKTASHILGYDLLDMCLHGPNDLLQKTVHSQPAVLVTSLAAVEKLKEKCPKAIESCITAAGYDIGEYAALVFTGAMTLDDAIRVVKVRSATMQSVSQLVPSGMVLVRFGASGQVKFACHAAKQYCRTELEMHDSVCDITSYLYPGCKIVSGHQQALEFIEKNKAKFGLTHVEHLSMSGAFHSRLMHSTSPAMNRVISSVELRDPIVPVHSNVTGLRYRSATNIRRMLVEQVYRPVRWEQTMHILFSRRVGALFPCTYEVGPGRHLGSVLQQVNAKAYEQYASVEV